ncbi:MAG TPA: GNAT family N-acetyltransferase [Nitrososphaerales archaeon]|nr:GNAT family N-acetyltransferase [Nitrososphaerales archaeon]
MGEAESARPEVKVRKARAGDLEQYAKNVQSVADEGGYIFVERVTEERKKSMGKLFKDKACLVIVAEVVEGGGRKLVGSLTLARYGDAEKTRHVRALGMLVVRGYRGRGIGTKLMGYALEWARAKKGVEKVSLGVFSNNKRAFSLYERFGFKVEGVRRKQCHIAGKHEDEIDMALFVK